MEVGWIQKVKGVKNLENHVEWPFKNFFTKEWAISGKKIFFEICWDLLKLCNTQTDLPPTYRRMLRLLLTRRATSTISNVWFTVLCTRLGKSQEQTNFTLNFGAVAKITEMGCCKIKYFFSDSLYHNVSRTHFPTCETLFSYIGFVYIYTSTQYVHFDIWLKGKNFWSSMPNMWKWVSVYVTSTGRQINFEYSFRWGLDECTTWTT